MEAAQLHSVWAREQNSPGAPACGREFDSPYKLVTFAVRHMVAGADNCV